MRISQVWIGGLVMLATAAFAMPAQAQDAPTDAPVLNLPVDQDSILVTTPAVVLEWGLVERATTHEVQLFHAEPVDGLEPIPLKTKVLNDASQELATADLLDFVNAADADGDSTFHWRVRGRNANGEGPWSDVWQFTLVEEDDSPVIDPVDAQTIDELQTLTVDVNATSPTGSTLTYSLDQASLDAGMTIDPVTGEITWTPSEEQGPGSYEVTVTVTDEEGNATDLTFTINVNEVNLPPELTPIDDTTAEVGVELMLTAEATDPDIPENTLTYSLDQASLDAGMTIDPVTGEITWTPNADQDNMSFEVTVTVTDDGDPEASDSETFTIQVGTNNPIIDPVDAQTIDELATLTVDINATSPTGSGLTYSLDQASLDASMTIDPVTGEITWTPSEEQGPGSYEVTVTVTDEDGNASDLTFTINVNEVNLPPELTPIDDATAEVGIELMLTAEATDPDIPENTLTYSLDQASLDAGMVIDPATGEITWTPTADQDNMSFEVTVTVTDDGDPEASDSETFTIQVGTSNPIIDPVDEQTIDELATLTVDINATSPTGSGLTYSLDQASLDAGMTIDPVTGEITWTPSEEQGPGSYEVTVTVTDEDGNASDLTFTINVNEVNLPPELAAIADTTAEVGMDFTITAEATDPDIPANNLTYSLDQASLDAGMMIDPATGVITWSPTDDQGPGTFVVTVTVTDDGDPEASDSETFTIVLGDVDPPEIDPIDDQAIDELTELSFGVVATDPAGSALTYSLDQASLDAGMMIDPATGVITWTPAEEQGPGSYDVTVTVTNEEGLASTQSFTITVNEVNLPPVLDPIDDAMIAIGDMLTLTAVGSDPDIPVNDLEYSLDQASLDAGMTIDLETGEFAWTPVEGQGPATYEVTVTVTDNGAPSASASQTFTITVDAVVPPTAVLETGPFCSAAADFDLSWSALDPTQFDTYIVQIATDPDFGNIVSEIPTTSATAKAPLADLDFGVTYYWRVLTQLGVQTSMPSNSSPFSRWPSEIEVAHTLAFPKATESNDFRMISVPGASGGILVASTFAGQRAANGPLRPNGDWDWSIWRENGSNNEYPGYLDQAIADAPFAPGVGYWAISTSAWQVPAQMFASAPLAEDRLFPIPLNQGNGDSDLRWTMIGNPFDFPVLWQDLIDENQLTESFDLWDWTGQRYESVTVMQPYKGYYYFNSKNDPTLQMPCILTPVTQAAPADDTDDGLKLQIAVQDTRDGDVISSVTVRSAEEATEAFDRFDKVVPPAYFEKHRVTLVNEDLGINYTYLAEEARASFEDEQVFNLELKAVSGQPAYVRIAGLEALAHREVYLFDDVLGRSFNLHENPVVMFEPEEEITRLRLLVGTADFIASEEANLIPDDFKMMQSYPNPFLDQTTIEFSLPAPEFVTLEVFNVLGQRVRTLVREERDAGYHRVAWDGTADSGESVASGMYLYVFKSQSHQATERLVRVR